MHSDHDAVENMATQHTQLKTRSTSKQKQSKALFAKTKEYQFIVKNQDISNLDGESLDWTRYLHITVSLSCLFLLLVNMYI